MIPVFPKSPFSVLPLIEFLARPSSNQLNRAGDDISLAVVSYQKGDVIGGHQELQYTEAITLLRLQKPVEVTAAVPGKLEKEFFLVTPVNDIPDIGWYVVSVRSRD